MLLPPLLLAAAVALVPSAQAQTGPYAGQQQREIKALSPQETAELLGGDGMGHALAAELNGYPGPAHVVELAPRLGLSAEQLERSRRLLDAHKADARRLGAAVVEAERALDRAFASRSADDATVRRLGAEIARLRGELRVEHLRAHLAQTALLTPEQAARYAELRGYGDGARHHPAHGGAHGGHRH